MILLIQIDYVRCTGFIKEFKFHYDSINSLWFDGVKDLLDEFKFHYDSINSTAIGDIRCKSG